MALAMAGMGLGGCADAEGTISVDPADHVAGKRASPACSVGIIFDWDGTAGRSTPAEAIREILDDYEEQARALPVESPGARPGDSQQDPASTAVIIRGLRAALESLAEATQGAENRSNVEFSAFDDAGTELAHIKIAHQRSGGYRVEQLNANAFPSDHLPC